MVWYNYIFSSKWSLAIHDQSSDCWPSLGLVSTSSQELPTISTTATVWFYLNNSMPIWIMLNRCQMPMNHTHWTTNSYSCQHDSDLILCMLRLLWSLPWLVHHHVLLVCLRQIGGMSTHLHLDLCKSCSLVYVQTWRWRKKRRKKRRMRRERKKGGKHRKSKPRSKKKKQEESERLVLNLSGCLFHVPW